MEREEKKQKANRLRREGRYLKDIASLLGVSVANASLYCRGVLPPGTPPSDSRKAKSLEIVRELHPQGVPVTEIAERIGVPASTLYDWIREAEIPRNSRQVYVTEEFREQARQKNTKDPNGVFRQEVVRLYLEEQWSTTDISTKFGVSSVTIGQWLEKAGVERRRQPTIRAREKLRWANLGAKRHNWKGGITPDRTRIRRSLPMQLAREACFELDNYTCQSCGERGGQLNAHHIWPFQRFPEWKFEVRNLITLCRDCHDRFHKAAGGHTKVAIGPFFYPERSKVREGPFSYVVFDWMGQQVGSKGPAVGGR